MLKIPVFNPAGDQIETIEVDEALFGAEVKRELLRLAVLRYEANQRVGTATTKNRTLVAGSTKKLYRQKGTGRARVGTRRSPTRRGGGVAHGKIPHSFDHGMPKKARLVALNSALLAKMQSEAVCVLTEFTVDVPKTKAVAGLLKALKITGTCLLSTTETTGNLWKSARNIPQLRVRPVADLNVWEVLWPKRLVFTREAFDALLSARSN
jgi:large subunit ribosomal protein L4